MPLLQLEFSPVSTTINGDGWSGGSAHPLEASKQGISLENQTIRLEDQTKRAPPIMSLSESLKCAGYRSLGSLARNAFFSNTVEFLVWPLEILDKSEFRVNSDEAVTEYQFPLSTKQSQMS